MSFSKVAGNLPTAIYLEFVEALKSGNWKDGSSMTMSQKEICAEALSLWILQSAVEPTDKRSSMSEEKAKYSYHWLMQKQTPDSFH